MRELYEQHQQAIFRYLLYLLGDEQLAQDYVQDTFVQALRSQQTPKNPRAWLRTIARNLAYDYLRRQRIIQWLPFTKEAEPKIPSILAQLTDKQDALMLYTALQRLPIHYREVLILRKIEGCSIEETAKLLNWNEHKVKNAQKSALQKLRQQLRRDIDGLEFTEEH